MPRSAGSASSTPPGTLGRLANCPFLASVHELDLCGNDLGNGGVNLLLRSPYLTAVGALDLSFNGVCDGGVRLLARSAALPRLRELALNDNGHVSGDGVAQLAESPHLAGLRVLDVSGNDVGDTGVRAVVGSPTLSRLHTFRVFANHIGDAGVAALVGSELFARLLTRDATLDLRQNAIGAAGTAALRVGSGGRVGRGDRPVRELPRGRGADGPGPVRRVPAAAEAVGAAEPDRRPGGVRPGPVPAHAAARVSGRVREPAHPEGDRRPVDGTGRLADVRRGIGQSGQPGAGPREPDGPSPPHRLDQAVGEVFRRLVPTPPAAVGRDSSRWPGGGPIL